MSSRLKKIIIPVVIVVVALGVKSMLAGSKKPPEQEEDTRKPLLVDVLELKAESVKFTVKSQGTMKPRFATTLVSEVNGNIVDVSSQFVVGGFFKKGDVLVRIEPADYLTAVKSAEAKLAKAQATYEEEKARAKVAADEWKSIANQSKAAPELYLRKPQLAGELANVHSAEAELERAKRDLERTEIRAPYDGLVQEKMADLGQFVSRGSQLVKIMGTETGEIRLPLSDRDIAFLNLPGYSPDELYSPSVNLLSEVGGKTFSWTANLVRSEGVVDSASRVVYAVAQVDDPYGLKSDHSKPPLSFGRFVRAEIKGTEVDNLIVVPRFVLHEGRQLLVIDNDDKIQLRDVVVARQAGQSVYISDGVEPGERIALTIIANPLAGTKITVSGNELSDTSDMVAEQE